LETQKKLTRNVIIKTLVDALEPLGYVHSFWEGGAAAFERIDEWSDLDLYIVVEDDKAEETFLAVEKALNMLSPIKQKYEVQHTPSLGLFQAFYRLEEASEYLILDLAIFTLSSPDKFLEPEIHGKAVFYFNKSEKVKVPQLDERALLEKLEKRVERLQVRFDMFNRFVQKEINRGNHLEAIDLYHNLTLATLVEALRIRYYPVHHDFRMRYIHYELPSEVTAELRRLYFVQDPSLLQGNYDRATRWFRELVSEIDRKGIRELLRASGRAAG
jgi:hypothetical protein